MSNAELRRQMFEAVTSLGEFTVEDSETARAAMRGANRHLGGGYYEDDDECAPLMSEAFLYPLLGKLDARSILARFDRIKGLCTPAAHD